MDLAVWVVFLISDDKNFLANLIIPEKLKIRMLTLDEILARFS